MKNLVLDMRSVAKIRVLCLLSLALVAGMDNMVSAATYNVKKTGPWSVSDTWDGTAPSNNINVNEDITINVPLDCILTIDEDVLISHNNQERKITLAGEGLIKIAGGRTFAMKNDNATSNAYENKNIVYLQCDIDIEEGGTLEFDVLNVAFDCVNGHYITGSGTVNFSRTGSDKTRRRIQVSGLTEPITGCNFTYATPQKFTYLGNCTYVLPGTYDDMSCKAASMNVYDNVIVANESWLEAGGITYVSKSNKAKISFNKFTGNSNQPIAFNVDVTLRSLEKVSSLTVADTNTLTIAGNLTWNNAFALPENIIIENGGTLNLTSNVTLTNNITIEEGGVLSLSGENIYFANEDLSKSANITGKGTLRFSRNGDATVHRIINCIDGVKVAYQSSKKITYSNTCTHIIPGTYYNLALNADTEGAIRMLCDTVIVNNAFNPGNDFTLQGNGGRKAFVVKGQVSGSKKLTFNNVNVALGKSDGDISVNAAQLNISENDSLIIAGNVKLAINTAFNGVDGKNGEIVINEGKALFTNGKTHTFGNDQTISGKGTFNIANRIGGSSEKTIKLTTYANINLSGGDKASPAVEYTVAGGTFTNTNTSNKHNIAFLVVDGGTYVSATGRKIENLTVKSGNFIVKENSNVDIMVVNGGTVQVETGKTLTVKTGNKLNVDGSATFVGKAGSKFSTDNVELFEGAALNIKDTVTLTRPLVVNNNATLVGGTVNDTLKWDEGVTPKISVTSGTLTISDTLTLAGDVMLEGAMKVADGGNLNLAGSTITFGPTTKFTGTQDTISFVAGVVITGLKNNPDVPAKYLYFPGAVTYDATCAAMFPGVYGNSLTLNTADGSNIAIFDTVKITGIFNWDAGRIVLNGNPLFVNKVFTAGSFGKDHMVVAGKSGDRRGKFIYIANEAVTSGTLDLYIPVGTSSLTSSGTLQYSFSPATINVDASGTLKVAAGDTIAVQVEGEALLGKSTDLRRYWTIDSYKKDFTGTVSFKYEPQTDDVLDYGKGTFWRVRHGNVIYDAIGDPQSPFDSYTFGNASIAAESSKLISGTWTACEWPAIETLYSFGSGDWDDPHSWTNNSAGSTQPDGWNTSPAVGGPYDIVILPKDVITGTGAGINARSVMLKNETSTLVIPKNCSVSINNLSGVGKLVIDGSGEFPAGIAHPDLFMAPGGGTTEFKGVPDGPATTFTLNQPTFNNLIINFGKDGEKMQLPDDSNHKLIINGSLTLTNGTIEYTKIGQLISVAGDIDIASKGAIVNLANDGGVDKGGDTLVVGGNLINKGKIKLTRRVWDEYNHTTASDDEGSVGRGILRFVGESDVKFECHDTTNISQLIVDKGYDWTYRVTLDAKKEKDFGLLGRATNKTLPAGFQDGKKYPANPEILYKPLWLKAGTLELTGKVNIRTLAETGTKEKDLECCYIPAQGCLHLNGKDVKVRTTMLDALNGKSIAWASIIPAGKIIIEQGTLDGGGSSGVTFVGTSFIEVKGGTLRGAQFRPSAFASEGITTFIQSGGTVIFDGCGDVNNNAPVFFMPEASYTFKMTDGTLEIRTTTNKGAFVVKSNPENGKISGGKIIINTGAAIKGTSDASSSDYLIATEMPLYNLILRNAPEPGHTPKSYARHYIKDINNETIINYKCNITASTVIQNDLIIENGVVFDTQGKPITIGKNLEVKEGSTVYTKGGGTAENEFIMNGKGKLTVNGTIVSSSSDASAGFYNLTLAEGANVSMKSDIAVRGLFKLANRAIMTDGENNRTYTMNGDVEIDGTYKKDSPYGCKMVIGGNNIYTTGTGSLYNVDINTGSELLLSDRTNTGRQTKLTITGKLNFVSETQFNIGSNNLEFGPEASVDGVFGPTRMIRTVGTSSRGVTKVFAANGEFTFPFGFVSGDSYYTPAKIRYSTATTYGSVTSRPVYGQAFRDENSLKCYWITEERGFSGASLTQTYYWYDQDGVASLSEGATSAWVPARRNGSDWETFGTNFIELDGTANSSDERTIFFDANVKSANGYYTCGLPSSFESGTPLYTSNIVADTLDWFDGNSWSESENGDPCGKVPTETTPVYIGGEANHIVKVDITSPNYADKRAECASLNIAPGSTLDLGDYDSFKAPIVDVDEALGAGKLRLSSPNFPEGDFGKFNGEFGGTVEYYGKGYAIPTASIDGSSLANYCNLLISGGGTGSDSISMPACSITVFDSLKVSGRVCTNPTGSFTIDIHKDFIIANGGTFEMFENGSANMQTVKVADSLIVAEGATMIANGTAANTVINLLQIGRDLIVDGTFKAKNGNFKFNTEFVGGTDSRISGSQNMSFNVLTCNKDALDNKLTLETDRIGSQNANNLLTLTKGTFVVAIGDGNAIDLTQKADLAIPADACLTVVSGTANVANHTNKNKLSLSGHIVVEGGVLRVGKKDGTVHNNILYASDGKPSITINGGELYINGQISRELKSETGSLIWRQTGGDVVIYGNERATIADLKAKAAFEVLNDGEFEMSGGTITVMNGGGQDLYGDILIRPATMNCTGGTIIVGKGSQKVYAPYNLHNLKVASGATLNAYTVIDVNELEIGNTGVFNALNHNLTIRKALKNYNNENSSGISAGFNYGDAAQLTKFVGSGMIYEGINASATQFNELEIDGDLTMVKGHSDIRVGGDLTQISGTVTDNGNVISLYGTLTYYGDFVGTGGIDFCNSGDVQYIEGNGMGSIGTITVSNTSEVYLNNSPFRITNKIILGASLYINRNNVVLADTATVESASGIFDGSRMIRLNGMDEDGGVTKYVKSGESHFFIPLGILHEGVRYYTPAIYDFSSNSKANRSITVKTINSLHKNLTFDPSKWLDYYWVVTTDGFGEDGTENFSFPESSDFSVKQTYVFPKEKILGVCDTLFPEYMYHGGSDEFRWVDLRGDGTSGSEIAWVKKDSVIFKPFGHIAGDYTVGVITDESDHDGIYVGRPVLYTQGVVDGHTSWGYWDDKATWRYKKEDGSYGQLSELMPGSEPVKIDGNPVHILPGDSVVITRSGTKAYSLTFDEGEKLGILDIDDKVGCNFGPVKGVGHLIMRPIAANEPYYKMPAGNFKTMLADERSIVEFAGGNGKLPNEIVGHVSLPLQNVILSGGGTKTLTKELGEYINKSMTIRNGTKLAFGNTPIYIKGDWIDENTGASGGFVPGSNINRSIVEFNGTSRQKIVLSGNNESFYRMIINNPSDVEIVRAESASEAGITINSSLEFTSGCLIDTASNTSVTLARNASVKKPGATSFVAGPLTWKMNAGDSKDFPIGAIDETAGKVYAPTKLNNVSKTDDYTVTFHSGTYSFDMVWPFTSMSNTEKWTVTSLSGTAGITAKLGLRVGSRTFPGITAAMLKRVKIAGNTGSEWEPIASSHTSGSLPTAMITSTDVITLSDYTEYTLGSSNSTARLLSKTEENQTDVIYICDGDADATAIPVYFTGMGGPYTVTYKITDKEKNKSVTVTSSAFDGDEGVISVSGSELAAKFGRTDGYSAQPYVIEITAMKDGSESGISAGSNKAEVYVLFNAKPVIDGAKTVGMGDTRVYSVESNDKVDTYTWNANSGLVSITPASNTADVYFGTNASTYNVTLTVRNTYTETHEKVCYRENTKVVTVDMNPQPEIIGEFGICRSNESAEFSTEKVAGHTYQWTIKDEADENVIGTITIDKTGESADNNKIKLTWGGSFTGSKATLHVTEKNGDLSKDVKRVITFYDDVELNPDDFYGSVICDDNVGTVSIDNTVKDYSYIIYKGETPMCEEFGGTDGGTIEIHTSEPLRYSDGGFDFTVVVKNKGCQKLVEDKSIEVHEAPSIEDFTIADDDLFMGNLVQIDYQKTSTIGIKGYEFIYSPDGVIYSSPAPTGIRKDDLDGKKMVIEIPKADRMKGILTINSDDDVMSCNNTYDIDKPISKAYLWSGNGDNQNWSNTANWWSGVVPGSSDDVVVRNDNKITFDGGKADTKIDMPNVNSGVAEVGNINIGAGAKVDVADGATLKIYKDVICDGQFNSTGNGAVAFSDGSHTVSGAGEFANLTNNGTVTAEGGMTVTGNITNSGSFTGTVNLKGESTQTVGGGDFDNVTVNSAGVALSSSINVSGRLTLTNGVVTSSESQPLVFTKDAKDVVGGSASSYIDGTAIKYGKTPFVFPTGNNGRLAMIGIAPGSDATDATYYSASYTLEAGKDPLTVGLSDGLSRVSQAEIWELKCPDRKSSKVTLYWSDARASGITEGEETSLVVAHYTEGKWKSEAARFDGVNSITTTSAVTSYSPFTFGTSSTDINVNPLPVTFVAFTGRQVGNSIVLEWATASESDNDYFEIERSIDGVNFVTVGYVDGAGNSNSLLNYQFADNAPEQGQLYYRLSQVDFDGTREYADKIVTVLYAGDDFDQLTIVPNPTHGLFRINVGRGMADGIVRLISQSGTVVRVFEINGCEQSLDISDLQDGVYILQYISNSKVLQHKVVKY